MYEYITKSHLTSWTPEISVIDVGLWAWFVTSQQKPILVHYSITQWWGCGHAYPHILVTSCMSNTCTFIYWGISNEKKKEENIQLIILSCTFPTKVILNTGKRNNFVSLTETLTWRGKVLKCLLSMKVFWSRLPHSYINFSKNDLFENVFLQANPLTVKW